jgi:hypothetical protein
MVPITTISTMDITEIPIIITVMSGANTIGVVRIGENMVNNMEEENNITDEQTPSQLSKTKPKLAGASQFFRIETAILLRNCSPDSFAQN